jgi:hypothetical protein
MMMACCGGKRLSAGAGSSGSVSTARPTPAPEIRRSGVAYFQYIGQGGIVVTGPATGNRYRFETNGAIVAVALADRAAVATVSRLHQVAGP